jgi:uncharacterized protein YndB with AHSA1/START domain
MAKSDTAPVPPVRRGVSVSWSPEAAFHRFTADFATWWPRATHSIGGRKVKHLLFECRVGGGIIEELNDGRRYQWGTVTDFEPPRRVAFTWHPSREPHEAQDVEVTFVPEGSGTRVELVSTGWERLGVKGRRMQKGYSIGWGAVLSAYAGRISGAMIVFAILSGLITTALRAAGKLDQSIDRAGGRLPSSAAGALSSAKMTAERV